jgi:hypothetical protein
VQPQGSNLLRALDLAYQPWVQEIETEVDDGKTHGSTCDGAGRSGFSIQAILPDGTRKARRRPTPQRLNTHYRRMPGQFRNILQIDPTDEVIARLRGRNDTQGWQVQQ